MLQNREKLRWNDHDILPANEWINEKVHVNSHSRRENRQKLTWCGIIDAKSLFLQPSRTKATDPGACGSSGSGETYLEFIQNEWIKCVKVTKDKLCNSL